MQIARLDDPHHAVARQVAQSLADRPTVHCILMAGSVARGEHLPTSDVDLLIVDSQADGPMRRTVIDSILVESITRTEQDWIARFHRPRPSWLYAVLDAVVLYDTAGTAARLKDQAERARQTYVAPDELRQQLATMIWHGQAKLGRAADQDEAAQGFWAAICVDTVLDGLYTIHNIPLPAGSRRLDHLDNVPTSNIEERLLQQYLTGTTRQRFSALVQLMDHLREHLGPADLEAP